MNEPIPAVSSTAAIVVVAALRLCGYLGRAVGRALAPERLARPARPAPVFAMVSAVVHRTPVAGALGSRAPPVMSV